MCETVNLPKPVILSKRSASKDLRIIDALKGMFGA